MADRSFRTSAVGRFFLEPGPKRGTWTHMIGGIAAAIVMGLVFYYVRSRS